MPSNCLERVSCPFLLQIPTVRITIFYYIRATYSTGAHCDNTQTKELILTIEIDEESFLSDVSFDAGVLQTHRVVCFD
jgi:hypothetical protein